MHVRVCLVRAHTIFKWSIVRRQDSSYVKAFAGELSADQLGLRKSGGEDGHKHGVISQDILYVNASGSNSKSLTSKAFQAFFEEYRICNQRDNLLELNLWNSDLIRYDLSHVQSKIRMLKGEGTEEDKIKFEPIKQLINQLISCDKLVVSSPMWNYSIPYILKQYIDIVVQPGVTFRETTEGPVGLVTGKPLLLITASGADYSEEPMKSYDFLLPYLRSIFGLIGFTDIHYITISNTSNCSREELFERITKVASEVARTF